MIIDINKLEWGWCLYWDEAIKLAKLWSIDATIDFDFLIKKTEGRFLSLRGFMPWWHDAPYTYPELGGRLNKMLGKSIEEAAIRILRGEVRFTY